MRVGVLVVAYESSDFIEHLLDRVPTEIPGAEVMIVVSDDCSQDDTGEKAEKWAADHDEVETLVIRHERNHGYGGNQKQSYAWAEANGIDVAVLLHGDEQYPPEVIPSLVAPILAGDADVVHGSRMIIKGGARRGGMPIDRFLGNRSLSWLLNRLAGAELTEWFSGFRAYRVSTLAEVDLAPMPDGFDFDTTITLDLLAVGARIDEVAIPTHYGEEISRVPLLRTGLAAVRHGVVARRSRARRPRTAPTPARDAS